MLLLSILLQTFCCRKKFVIITKSHTFDAFPREYILPITFKIDQGIGYGSDKE
jgi:hypothetical protein